MVFYLWLIFAMLLFSLELFLSGLVLAGFGASALLVTLLSVLHLPLSLQWLVFAGLSLISIPITRPIARLLTHPEPQLANVDYLISKEGMVIETIDGARNSGRVRVETEDWRAESDRRIPQGQRIVVLEVQGNRLIVSPRDWGEEETDELLS